MNEIIECYRFVTDDLRSENGCVQWTVGEWVKQEGELELCGNGLHACMEPFDSLKYVFGSRWFKAEARGWILEGGDKFCASEMRLVEEIPVTVLHQFAVDCAYRVLSLYEEKYPDDVRPREALKVKQAWIDDPTEENYESLTATWAAVRAAAAAGRDAEERWQREHLRELINAAKEEA